MAKQVRKVHHVSLRPYLDKLVRAEAGDGSISAVISKAVEKYFDNDHGLDQEYLDKLHEVAKKEKRDPDDMIRVIVEEHLDKVKYIRTFL